MTIFFERILPSIIREGNGGGESATAFTSFAELIAGLPSMEDNERWVINYDGGSCRGSYYQGNVTMDDWLPFSALGGGTWSNTDDVNSGCTFTLPDGEPTVVKVAGNSSEKYVIYQNDLAFPKPDMIEYEVEYTDTTPSGSTDRLAGVGIVDDTTNNVFVDGNAVFLIMYRWNNGWNIFQRQYINGAATFTSPTGMQDSGTNGRYDPAKMARLSMAFINTFGTTLSEYYDEGQTGVKTSASGTGPAIFAKDAVREVRFSMGVYAYAGQISTFKLKRFRMRSMKFGQVLEAF